MSFTVRRVEDPTIYVRRNIRPDVFGISSAWDNIADIKQSLSRLEDDVVAAKKWPKVAKNIHSSDGKVLKEISSEKQQFGKVTRFQLLDNTASKAEARKPKADWSKVSDISSIPKAGYSNLNREKDGYSPTRYTYGVSKPGNIHSERPTYFETTTIHPTVLNDPPSSKDSSFANTTVNSSSSQQFSVTSSPSFHGKTVLARNEAGLQKIKEKVQKQKAMLSKQKDKGLGGRRLHESNDHVSMSDEPCDQNDVKFSLPLKRKVGTISASGPTYKGFNAVSEPKQKKVENKKQAVQTKIPKDTKNKVLLKPHQKQEGKNAKGKMTRIIGSKRQQEVITTTSWRDGHANVKRLLNAKKAKTADKETKKTLPGPATERTEKGPLKNDRKNATFQVCSQSDDEISEGRLSSDDDVIERFNAKIEKFEAEKDVSEVKDETYKPSENVSIDSDEENIKDILSKEAKSMLADLAQDSSGDEERKCSPSKKNTLKRKKAQPTRKPTEDTFPKGKTRHYDQAEVQKYMAHQLAERKKKQKQEKIQKKKREEEKQQRLKDLYERQKKSFAPAKKDKRLGKTFSFGNFDINIPGQERIDPEEDNEEYINDNQVVQKSTQNESDKENKAINDISNEPLSEPCSDDDGDVTLTGDISTNQTSEETSRHSSLGPILPPEPSEAPLDQRVKRLTALQATALALQSRLQTHALRLSGGTEGAVSQPAVEVSAQPKARETGFQGILPGVANIRQQADENEKQSTRAAAATTIQAAYRGHTVRKRNEWNERKTTQHSRRNTTQTIGGENNARDMSREGNVEASLFPGPSLRLNIEEPRFSEGSSDEGSIQFTNIRPFYGTETLNNDLKRSPAKQERKFQLDDLRTRSNFLRNDITTSHLTAPTVHYEPRGDRFSVMNIFSRRHPTLPIDDILNDEPGSETASLLEVDRRKSPDQNIEYDDDFTDVDISSVTTEGDLKKDASKAGTYSECFETDEDVDKTNTETKTKSGRSTSGRSTSEGRDNVLFTEVDVEKKQLSEREKRNRVSPLHENDHILSSNEKDGFVIPSTRQHRTRSSPSISPSEENEPIRRRVYIPRPMDRTGGNRLSPDSLQRKLTAEINLLENVEDSVRQVNDIERTRAVSLAQQETVSLAQILKAKQQTHEHEMHHLRLKAKEEAIQAARELEKTRQAAAMAASSAAERLAEVQSEAIKTNAEHSRKYIEEATKMTSDLLTNTSNQLAEFCKNVTSTTSAAVEGLHKTKRPTTTLVERATSISEGHAMNSEHSTSDDRTRTGDEHTRTRDVISNQSKSFESLSSVASPRQAGGYSSDEFDSYASQTARNDGSDVKSAITDHASLTAESIAEDLPEKSVSEEDTTIHEDDTTVNDDSDLRDGSLPRERSRRNHGSVSSILDYSSQFDDSSHPPTDEDIDFNFLLPSREHRRKSMNRIKDISFSEEKRKEKSHRTPFESDDSFGKFTVDMIQQYVHEEEVRTKHQAAILRLREKSLKDKTKAELQWLEQMKKQSRDKGSDDVMPSIKKRERGIRMKHKAEKEEIKCLKAANRAASFQRRFMIYQQQEIRRLHQATLNIREKIQKDPSKKDRSSRSPSQSHPRTSSPVKKQDTQSTPSSRSKSKPDHSAKSISEDISGDHGSSHISPNNTASSFPSYSTPKSEDETQGRRSAAGRGEEEPSSILQLLSTVDGQVAPNQSEELVKIHKMLLERQQKLVKDESDVNSMLQKVTEMLKNQRNLSQSAAAISNAGQSGSSVSTGGRSKVAISEASESKLSNDTGGKSPSEQSIPEEISRTAKSVTDEAKTESAERTANDYDNATFESDDSTPRSRRSMTSQHMTSQNGEANVEDEILSLTETSDQSDVEERVRRLNEVLEKEKKKAELLERKKQKIKRSVMKKEALKLEIEIKNTRDDIHRKLAEIKTASAGAQKTSPVSNENISIRSKKGQTSQKPTGYTTPLSSQTSPRSDRWSDGKERNVRSWGESSSSHEVEESFIEVIDDDECSKTNDGKRRSWSEISRVSAQSDETDIPEELPSKEKEESIVEIIDVSIPDVEMRGAQNDSDPEKTITNKTSKIPPSDAKRPTFESEPPVSPPGDSSDILEDVSEHSQSTTSVPEQVPSIAEDEASKSSEIPEEISERSYTPIPSDESISEEYSKVAKDTHSKASGFSHSPKSSKDISSKTANFSYGDDTFEYTEPGGSIGLEIKTSPEKSRSISEHLTGPAEESPSVPNERSYTEPESDKSDRLSSSDRLKKQSQSDAEKNLTKNTRGRSEDSDDSLSSEITISERSITSSRSTTKVEKSRNYEQDTTVKPTVPKMQSTRIEEQRRLSHEHDETQSSPRVDSTESRSESPSIAEDIVSNHEDESEGGSFRDELIEGRKEDEIKEMDKIGQEPNLEETGVKNITLDEINNEFRVDESGLLDQAASDKHGLNEVKQGVCEDGQKVLSSPESVADVSPVLKRNEDSRSHSSRSSQLGTNKIEYSKDSGDEIQYSDDFDDASIPEEISEIDEELADDASNDEDSAKFITNNKTTEDDQDTRGLGYELREHESEYDENTNKLHSQHVLDNITNDLYKNIVADSLNTMKNLTKQSDGQEQSETNQQNRKTLTKAVSTLSKNLVDREGSIGANMVESGDARRSSGGHICTDVITESPDTKTNKVGIHDDDSGDEVVYVDKYVSRTDTITDGQIDTKSETGQVRKEQPGTFIATAGVTLEDDTDRVKSGKTETARNQGNTTIDNITKDLLADAIMQMIEIKRYKNERNARLAEAVENKASEAATARTLPELSPSKEIVQKTTSTENIPEIKSQIADETAVNNALMIAKTNQILNEDALRSIDDDIAGLLGTPLDDEDEFPVNVTNFSADATSDNELPEYSPMIAVPHNIEELIPMVNSTVDVLLEQRRLGMPLNDCIPTAHFLSGETENDSECVSIQSYRHLVFDLTKEVVIDTISQNEPATQPPWAKTKWKSGQKLSRNFKRWKSDEDIRAAVLERVTNIIGLGAPRATMATLPRKTPVRGNKKDNVDAILIEELRQEEPLWTDYQEDETNVKFQVADAILNMLLEDTARVFSAIQAKTNVPDNVLVV
ncbi:centrosome-associated protein 350-like isoform X2 [Dendronephthya gigantea]|uniref:centrosome-associated protein 350-like isoform X2 n=1 Tax=Dendronephthya gigantea TaxID=151771 RepID=UPI00106B96F4|nr:centrosome-associated protein 350-like isoform X2 [Dendronephthya gigantea]